jgi:uracil-DNA glycosylase
MPTVKIEASWHRVLAAEFEQPYFQALSSFIRGELAAGKTIYPPSKLIFHAFECTPFDAVKVVILGQDPYHNPDEAMGLCFSVPVGVCTPPSLQNIYKEIQDDLGLPIPQHGDLTGWTQHGVFLLNAMLTVEKNKPASHGSIGWQHFTDTVIGRLSADRDGLVFMLWGKFAQSKAALIDGTRHLILQAAHPSPYSATAGFFGCHHFSKANAYLQKHGKAPVDWSLA